jgi:hypothetical protein
VSAAAVQDVFASPDLRAIAVVVADGRMGHRGFGPGVAKLEAVLRAARQLLRDTTPAVEVVDFRFADGRAIVSSIDQRVVLVRTTSSGDAAAILRGAASDARTIEDELTQAPAPASSLVLAAALAAPTRETVTSAMNSVLLEARKHLGGPVIRNYLKRSRGDVAALGAITVGLDGKVADPSGADAASEDLVAGAGAWLRAFLTQASVVAPELSALDIVAITTEHDAALRPLGFYSDNPTGQP